MLLAVAARSNTFVLVDRGGRVKILYFGFAHMQHSGPVKDYVHYSLKA